jgi:hypothetical protein
MSVPVNDPEFALEGVTTYNEDELQKQILARAQTKGLTGVATAASLQAILAVQADTSSDLSRLDGLDLNAEDALNRDRLRIRSQLLNRLSLLRKCARDTSATIDPAPSAGTAATTRAIRGEKTLMRSVATAGVDSGEAVLAALIATKAPPHVTPSIGHSPAHGSVTPTFIFSEKRPNEGGNGDSTGIKRKRKPHVQPAVASDLVGVNLPQCPLCFRSIPESDARSIDRHVERCLRRQRHQDNGVHFSSPHLLPAKQCEAADNVFDSEPSADEYDTVPKHARTESLLVSNKEERGEDVTTSHGHAAGQRASSTQAVRLSRGVRASNIVVDDWNEALFRERLAATEEEEAEFDTEDSAAAIAGDAASCIRIINLSNGLQLPRRIARALLPYQTTGVLWLYELYRRRVGGILGDEMGLGKTVQVAALFGALHTMNLMQQPSLVVCPATIVAHWVRELTTWHPQLRVFVLHGSYKSTTPRQVVDAVFAAGCNGHIVVTTYDGLRMHQNLLLSKHWGYAVLDEGHRLRCVVALFCNT